MGFFQCCGGAMDTLVAWVLRLAVYEPAFLEEKMSTKPDPVLEIEGLTHSYGSLRVLNSLHWCIRAGERWWLSGANGAGKSTLINLIAGHLPVEQGRLKFCGHYITHVSATERSRRGLSRSFQLPQLFASMTVAEHWRAVGVFGQHDLRKPDELSYAERKRLDVELALVRSAQLFLLDEPSAGLSQAQARNFYQSLILRFPATAMLIIEHEPARLQGVVSHAAQLSSAGLETVL
jgi:branched-chain amino acid transport system ATP-binding protein